MQTHLPEKVREMNLRGIKSGARPPRDLRPCLAVISLTSFA